MNDLFNEPDMLSKERVIEILILMADYLSEGEVKEFSLEGESRYSLLREGYLIGGLCSLVKKLEMDKDITTYEQDAITRILKDALLKSRGYTSSPSLYGSYWFTPMSCQKSKEVILEAQSDRLEFLHEVTLKLQNS